MFGLFENLTKAIIGVASIPVTLVADVVTLGGALTDKDQPYTASTIEGILVNLDKAAK